jgi:hypothetical protein
MHVKYIFVMVSTCRIVYYMVPIFGLSEDVLDVELGARNIIPNTMKIYHDL